MGGLACQAILEEFENAKADIKNNPASIPLWQSIIAKYHPTLLGACKNAIEWSVDLAEDWLQRNMCNSDKNRVKKILSEFNDHSKNKSHSRHISKAKCKELGLAIIDMEDDNDLQDKILTTHHAFMHTFGHSNAVKIVENQFGTNYSEVAPIPQK